MNSEYTSRNPYPLPKSYDDLKVILQYVMNALTND